MIGQNEAIHISATIEEFMLWTGYRDGFNMSIRKLRDRYYWEIRRSTHTVADSAASVSTAIGALNDLLDSGNFAARAKRPPLRRQVTANLFG
jgi:hypothetical protein